MPKAKVPYFLNVYSFHIKWNGRSWGNHVWRRAFNNNIDGPLPMDPEERTAAVMSDCEHFVVTLFLLPPGEKGTKKHRVYTICPRCQAKVWAGRIHQHKCEVSYE